MEKLAKAKSGLILDQPFFASLLLSMPMIQDNSVPTMATDGDSIRYNSTWVDSLSVGEVTFVLAHEVLHCVFQHCLRIGEKNPDRWNQATDYIINELLTKEKIGVMPKGGLLDSALVAQGEGTAEGVYRLLPDLQKDQAKTGERGGALDSLSQPSQDESVISQKESEMRVKVIQAKNAAKMVGKLSSGLDRLIKDVTRTETDWRSVLRRFLSDRAKLDLSYSKPKRRFLADDIYLPSLTGEKLGAIAIAIDCSGSINETQLAEFESEVQAVLQDAQPSEVRVIYFDSEVLRSETFTQDDNIKLCPIGGGGTAFSPVISALEASEVLPIACIFLTDLLCDDFGPVPSFPVLWASTCRRHGAVPFGEVTYLKERKK